MTSTAASSSPPDNLVPTEKLTKPWSLRWTEHEHALASEAAYRDRLPLSEWIRRLARDECARLRITLPPTDDR